MRIRTNNVPRLLIDADQLTPKEREEFDYLDWTKIDAGENDATFFRYKGDLYDLGVFEVTPDSLKPWDGYTAHSLWTGTVVRICKDTDYVIVGSYISD